MQQFGLVYGKKFLDVAASTIIRCQKNNPLEPPLTAIEFPKMSTHLFMPQCSRINLRFEPNTAVPTAKLGISQLNPAENPHANTTTYYAIRCKLKEFFQKGFDETRFFTRS
ncbi:MAG: hypothetical protein AAB288_05025 [Acidobacteriota bacterium]